MGITSLASKWKQAKAVLPILRWYFPLPVFPLQSSCPMSWIPCVAWEWRMDTTGVGHSGTAVRGSSHPDRLQRWRGSRINKSSTRSFNIFASQVQSMVSQCMEIKLRVLYLLNIHPINKMQAGRQAELTFRASSKSSCWTTEPLDTLMRTEEFFILEKTSLLNRARVESFSAQWMMITSDSRTWIN